MLTTIIIIEFIWCHLLHASGALNGDSYGVLSIPQCSLLRRTIGYQLTVTIFRVLIMRTVGCCLFCFRPDTAYHVQDGISFPPMRPVVGNQAIERLKRTQTLQKMKAVKH